MIDKLREEFHGVLLLPGDDGYDEARSVFNGEIDHRPAVIARCGSARDVSAALASAQRDGFEVGVRGGGHGYAGAAVPEGGVMIDLSLLNDVVVDPVARRARCGGGTTLADLDAATQAHGLAVTGGTVSHTGVGGLTLGGGIGWLTGRCGLTADNLLSAEVVLADGRCVRASAAQHADLWWALRGGGGNFGIVTEFEFQLHEVGPLVQFGMVFWEQARSAAALRVARDVLLALTRDAGGMLVVLNAPPAPFVPEEHRFAPGVALMVAGFAGPQEHAAVLSSAREALTPLFEFATEMPYTDLQRLIDESAPWGIHAYSKALYLDDFSDAAVDVLAAHLPAKSSPMSLLPIFPLGGAFAEVAEDATAFGGRRTARFVVNMDAIAPDAAALAPDREWVRSLWSALSPFAASASSYVNFMAEFDEDRVRAAYGADKYRRLAAIKGEYDPGNVLHLNANIKPG